MTDGTERRSIERRHLLAVGAGAAVLAAAGSALGQAAELGRVAVERRPGGVLALGLDWPQGQNRLSPTMLIALGKAFHQLEHDGELRVAVIHGLGSDFCQGIDRASFAAAQAAGLLPPKDPDFVNPLGLRPPHRSKPLVVAVHGGTKYVGHELFLAADIRIAARDTVFSQGEVARGVFPGGGATVRFTREVGWGNAMRYMLTGEEWGAEEARRMGLVQEITEPGKQLARALEIAGRIAANAPLGVRATLASAQQALAGEEAAFVALQAEFARLLQSNDAREFEKALREGRRPDFHGN